MTLPIYRAFLVLACCGLGAWVLRDSSYPTRVGSNVPGRQPDVVLGREVYIAEGCIHCHSQYARPGTRDVLQWGPGAKPGRILSQQPPLIGNRRQGPDLLNVGNRRTPEWQKAHLQNPRALVMASRMPSYPHLFANGDIRGEALVAFLCSLGSDTSDRRAQQIGVWEPALNAQPDRKSAPVLYRADCAACHGEQGGGDGPMAQVFGGKSKCQLQPTALSPANGGNPFSTLPRIIKFGIPGTQMPGYETLTDSEVLGLTHYITSLRQKGNTHENSDR